VADSYSFAVDVFRCIGERLSAKAAELELLLGTAAFHGWLVGEAFLACKGRQEGYPYSEVAASPTYASEGVAGGGVSGREAGDLRVGGPDDGANHCWLFAEFVVAGDGSSGEWKPKVVAAADRLKQLGWKRSAALLITVSSNRVGDLPDGNVWDGLALTDPVVIPLPGGGEVVLTAFDVKRDPADTWPRLIREPTPQPEV
jgi:hypothetical protein